MNTPLSAMRSTRPRDWPTSPKRWTNGSGVRLPQSSVPTQPSAETGSPTQKWCCAAVRNPPKSGPRRARHSAVVSADNQFVFAAVADQRRQFASLIDDLDDAQLATPSLCSGWDIKTVAAHVVSTVLDGMPGFLQMAIRCGSLSCGIDRLARRRAQAPMAEISPLSVNTRIARSRHRCSAHVVRWPTSWCTAAMSGLRWACRLSPMSRTQCRRWTFSPAAGRSVLCR